MIGILYLTNVPKLKLVIPTANAKIKENIRQNCSKGD